MLATETQSPTSFFQNMKSAHFASTVTHSTSCPISHRTSSLSGKGWLSSLSPAPTPVSQNNNVPRLQNIKYFMLNLYAIYLCTSRSSPSNGISFPNGIICDPTTSFAIIFTYYESSKRIFPHRSLVPCFALFYFFYFSRALPLLYYFISYRFLFSGICIIT